MRFFFKIQLFRNKRQQNICRHHLIVYFYVIKTEEYERFCVCLTPFLKMPVSPNFTIIFQRICTTLKIEFHIQTLILALLNKNNLKKKST